MEGRGEGFIEMGFLVEFWLEMVSLYLLNLDGFFGGGFGVNLKLEVGL